jgi:hypothetical protein
LESNGERDATQLGSTLTGNATPVATVNAIYQPFRIVTKTSTFWIAERTDDDARIYIQWDLGTALLVVGTGATLPTAGISSGTASLVCRAVEGSSLQ